MTKPNPLSDFRKFLFVVWKHLNLPDPTPVQYDIAKNIQHGDKRMIVEAFRGVGKKLDYVRLRGVVAILQSATEHLGCLSFQDTRR